jgi:AraC-like DNA-binding protein
MASTFIDGLPVRHTSKFKGLPRGRLDEQVLGRLRDCIFANLDEHIEAGALARIAGRSTFHFTRVFARSVGMTWLTSRPPLASPTRAICRGGFGAFTAFRRLSLGFDRQNSRNLHDPWHSSP